MPRSKKPAKQRGVGSVDFKKIKRKIGRKLPPPKNATNTEVKSKAIVLPEQSVAVDKEGLAVNKKGLTLKELLHQSSHHNARVRKDALIGIKDLLLKHPTELRACKPIIEKLRERICDSDNAVRETLYHLFKMVVFPGCKEENQHGLVDSIMPYIFNAMTNLAVDVRLMAFKFFDLIVEYYPPTFSLYSEKILQHYEEILQKNQFYVQDKRNLKTALAGLVRCLLLLPSNKEEVDPCYKDVAGRRALHAYAYAYDESVEPTGFLNVMQKLKDLLPVLINCFQEFTPLFQNMQELDARSFDCMLYILQSIDLSFKFLTSGKYGDRRVSPYGRPDTDLSDQNIVSAIVKKLLVLFPLSRSSYASEKEDDRFFSLNSVITEIFFCLGNWICHPNDSLGKFIQVMSQWNRHPDMLLERFLEFIEIALSGKVCNGNPFRKAVHVKYLLSLLPLVPKLVSQAIPDLKELQGESGLSTDYELLTQPSNWGPRLLQAFTVTFENSRSESTLKLACLSAIEEMMELRNESWHLDAVDPDFSFQKIWVQNVPLLLIQLGDKNPSSSMAVLHLLLRLGHRAQANPLLAIEHHYLQNELCHFFSTCEESGNVTYGPFMRLNQDCQQLAIHCIRFFSQLNPLLLRSVAFCCTCEELNPSVLLLIVEALHSAYRDGHVLVADHISFLLSIVSSFKFYPENDDQVRRNGANILRHETLLSVTRVIISCLSQMGDPYIILRLIENVIIREIRHCPLPNVHALLSMLIELDSKPTRLSKQNILKLGEELPGYMFNIMQQCPGDDKGTTTSLISRHLSYLEPCFSLYKRSQQLLDLVLAKMRLSVTESSSWPLLPCRINAVVSILTFMNADVNIRKFLCLCVSEIEGILQGIHQLQTSGEMNATFEEKTTVQSAVDRIKRITISLRNRVETS